MKAREIAAAMRTLFASAPILGLPFPWRFRHHGGEAAAWKWSGARSRHGQVKKLRYQKGASR